MVWWSFVVGGRSIARTCQILLGSFNKYTASQFRRYIVYVDWSNATTAYADADAFVLRLVIDGAFVIDVIFLGACYDRSAA